MTIDDLILVLANINAKELLFLVESVGSAKGVVSLSESELRDLGLGAPSIERLKSSDTYSKAEQEMSFIEKYNIRTLVFGTPEYPKLLGECCDAPYILFVKGDLDFNDSDKWISIVGTRKYSSYGLSMTGGLVKEFAAKYADGVVVSGLANGIDTIAHKAALENNLKTVAVLAHGFKTIYPIDNRTLAAKIIAEGGALVTEYTSDKMPLPHCFLQRNRIVAGLCGATLIIESPMKGGSMNTAATANSYSREVFALPGRANDDGSQGTNNLIKSTRASMVTSFSDVEAVMGWESIKKKSELDLFDVPLQGYEREIYKMLAGGEKSIDEMTEKMGINASDFSSIIGKMEIMGFVKAIRGRMYIRI